MRSGTIAFSLGICALWACPWPPPLAAWLLSLGLLAFAAAPGGYRSLRFWLFCCFVFGLLWALWRAEWVLGPTLAHDLQGQRLSIRGQIVSLPERHPDRVRFNFDVLELTDSKGKTHASPGRVRLSWYGPAVALHSSEHWQLQVRLKRPHSWSNPGGFDYQRWLFQHRIRATGYVYTHPGNHRLQVASDWNINRLREFLANSARQALAEHPAAAALLIGLGVGDRSSISTGQWEVLRQTGTSHLLAISGLHIGMVAGLAAWFGKRLWFLFISWLPGLAAPHFAILMALPAAAVYAALAGFSLPTCRALLMLGIVAVACLRERRLASGDILALALLVILLFDPLAPVSAGFWLSFYAVATILLSVRGYSGASSGKWSNWWRIQLSISLTMLPLLLAWFQQYPLLSMPANLVAIPWVGLLVLPPTLAGFALLPFLPEIAQWILQGAALMIEGLWSFLQLLAKLEGSFLQPPAASGFVLLCGFLGVGLLLLPGAVLLRMPAFACLLPLFFHTLPLPADGEVKLALLDVGQGLATVVRTRRHLLVYDTGAGEPDRQSVAERVLIPYLRRQGLEHIHVLMISHADNDHAGGVYDLLKYARVDKVLTGEPQQLAQLSPQPCLDGQAWNWDGVRFEVMHPAKQEPDGGNNHSCVLKVSAHGRSILLTGDIEEQAERELLARHPNRLFAEVLLMPHHGSRTSSSLPFIKAVAPQYALISVGHLNRFHLPKKDIIERYFRRGTRIFSTAQEGMIEVQLSASGLQVETHRPRSRRIWHEAGDG